MTDTRKKTCNFK